MYLIYHREWAFRPQMSRYLVKRLRHKRTSHRAVLSILDSNVNIFSRYSLKNILTYYFNTSKNTNLDVYKSKINFLKCDVCN